MPISESEILTIHDESLPPGFWPMTLDHLVHSNKAASAACSALEVYDSEKRDVFGTIQRASFEGRWRRNMASAFRCVQAKVKKNKKGTASHTILTVGRLILTESALKNGAKLPRLADFRYLLAQTSQLSLFDDVIFDPKAPVYGIFVYGYDREYGLNFAKLVIPDQSFNHVIATIPLTGELLEARQRAEEGVEMDMPTRGNRPPMQRSGAVAPEATIPEPSAPRLRPKRKLEGEA